MTEHHSPIEGLLDRLVYAPLGLVTDARTVVPQLAERGRMQVANAKMMGRFAVQMGSSEAAKRVGGLEGHLREALVGFGFLPPEVGVDTEPSIARSKPVPQPVKTVSSIAPVSARKARPTTVSKSSKAPAKSKARSAAKPTAVAADDLAIPGYDSLAASQVVSRLAGLRPEELTAVQRYELHNRGRKTILGRISQLQAS